MNPCAWCNPAKVGDVPVSHSICRRHELELLSQAGILNEAERREFERNVRPASMLGAAIVASVVVYVLGHFVWWASQGFPICR